MTTSLSLIRNRFARNGWHRGHLLLAMAFVAVGVAVTFDAWRDLVRIALRDEESSHALLVPVIALWLFWVRRGRLRHCHPMGQWVGAVLAVVAAVLYLVGDAFLIEAFWHGGAVLLAVGCLLTVFGRQILVDFLPVFLVLMFLVPVPGRVRQRLAVPLQRTTAQATQEICDLSGMAVDRSGNLLRINGVDVAIGEACNGMRMTFALVLVSFAFAMTMPMHGYVRVLIVLLSPLSAVLCNVIRLVPTVWVYGNYQASVADAFHDISGWIMLFVAFVLLTAVIRLLKWFAVPVVPFSLAHE